MADDSFEFEAELTPDECRAALKACFGPTSPRLMFASLRLLALPTLATVPGTCLAWFVLGPRMALHGLGAIGIVSGLFALLAARNLRSDKNSLNPLRKLGPVHWRFTPAAIESRTERGEYRRCWRYIGHWKTTAQFCLLYARTGDVQEILPCRVFADVMQQQRFQAFLRQRVIADEDYLWPPLVPGSITQEVARLAEAGNTPGTTFTLTRGHLKGLARAWRRRQWSTLMSDLLWKLGRWTLLALFLLAVAFAHLYEGSVILAIIGSCVASLILWVVTLIVLGHLARPVWLRTKFKSHGTSTHCFATPGSLLLTAADGESRIPWKGIKTVERVGPYLLFEAESEVRIGPFPTSSFENHAAADAFFSFAEQRIAEAHQPEEEMAAMPSGQPIETGNPYQAP